MEPGEGTTDLHQAAAFAQSAQVDSGEAELLDYRGDTAVALGVVPGEEYDLPTGGMPRVRRDVGTVERVEGFDNTCSGKHRRNVLASSDVAEIGDLEVWRVADELVGGVDHYPALPVLHSGGSEGVRDVGPPHGQQNQLGLCGFGGCAGRSQWAETVHDRSDESGSATVRQDYLVSGSDCVTRNCLRDLTGAEHPYAHQAVDFIILWPSL